MRYRRLIAYRSLWRRVDDSAIEVRRQVRTGDLEQFAAGCAAGSEVKAGSTIRSRQEPARL